MKCGFDEDFFVALKDKLEPKSNFQKHGMLLFDEMQVRERKCVNSKTLTYAGFVDHGEGVNRAKSSATGLANHALVFMFIPFGESYTQPIGVFASRGPTKGTVLSQLVLQAIILLEKAGALVDGIVCDGASTNRRMWMELGINGKLSSRKNSFEHPMNDARKVYVFSDVPHLVKCVRNRLVKQRSLKVNGRWVHWSCYVAVYKEDCKNAGGLKVCPKITHHHIYPSHMELMRVKLATQIFSRSMASALKYYTEVGVLHTDTTEGTIAFTEQMNDVFDAMNRRHPKEGLRMGCKDLECIKNSLKWLDDWEQEVCSGAISKDMFLAPSTAEGLRVTMLSMLELSEYLLAQCGFKNQLLNVKDRLDSKRYPGVVYKVPCADCSCSYIGETGNFTRRLKEHKRDVANNKKASNALAEHADNHGHLIDWDNAAIIAKEKNSTTRLLLESVSIQTTEDTINRTDGNLPAS
ncbi:hypothetical protein HPB50_021558 [Hyalomma asiaticum]|uniref:Uncharacterized protein n=1 Tax=Hyalomma asiaticum TaxID=266040 RepID=A0ACB7T182_HYAAI|nr:hypothetical protein HPB50_021558 [Hyalomma asiaticum]